MRANIWLFPFLILLVTGCATRTRSLILGGAGGVAIGAYVGSERPNASKQNENRNTLLGAAIGAGVGLLSAYLLHDHVEERMKSFGIEEDERLRFGDLPPNPFNPANQRFLEPQYR